MSYVTNIMITGLFDEIEIENIKKELERFTEGTMPFMQVEGDKVGGSKCLEADVLIGAFNYMDRDLFISVIKDIEKAVDPDTFIDMQVFVKNQEDDRWQVHLASELTIDHFR